MTLYSWITSSLVRHFPRTPVQPSVPLHIDAALNERLSFQVVLRLEGEERQTVQVRAAGPAGWSVRVRRVGYVPAPHFNTPLEPDPLDRDGIGYIPGYVPDPLFDEDMLLLPQEETHAFWISVVPAPDAQPGSYEIAVTVHPEMGDPLTHTVAMTLHNVRLARRRDFHITHWFYVDALIDWYRTDLFDERFWAVLPRYLRDVVEHGQDTLYVPVFTPPLDGVKRPSQLLHVTRLAPDEYAFDWRDVKRYVNLARDCGIDYFEWSHLFTQWGVRHALRIYEGQGRDESLLWEPETGATSETYRAFLNQFLPELYAFLEQENLLDRSYFHLSDEPHGEEHLENYRQARVLLRELAPWMTVMDALTEIEFARQKVTNMPIPSIRTALDFAREGIPSWCYYCCGPRGRYLNRLLDTPLPKIAMHGLLFYRWPFGGFLHWGYNYWYESQTRNMIDPFTVTDGLAWGRGWAYGDTFEVYPGPDGPIDSIRWEVFGESLQDYQLLQALGVARDDPRLAEIASFTDFPKTEVWRQNLRARLFECCTR
ncbi:MAG: DUF4091 domain-containing protein [Anaerolineae bacterium]|nr:DUF4091 domain-containing protein [Anaerolineae bacterium]